jgi:signal transduction histidine kinase
MIKVIGCITDQHSLPLVLLAAAICAFGAVTALSLLGRARDSDGKSFDWRWLVAAALVAGASVWSTHFVAMLAFKSPVPLGYNVPLTALSIALAMLITAVGYVLAVRWRLPLVGGALFGIAVGVMHFTGMKALTVPATLEWDWVQVTASVVFGSAVGALCLRVFMRGPGWRNVVGAAGLMSLAIVGLHFTAMSALTLVPDPRIVPLDNQLVVPPAWIAIAVAGVTALVTVLGFIAAVVDYHLAGRATKEAERLRLHVTALEAKERELQATAEHLMAALDAAAAASQAKSQFLATMSHELRTPLNAIIGFSELLQAELFGPIGDKRYVSYSEDILKSGRHLLALVNDVLDFSKIDAGHLDLQDTDIDVAKALGGAVRMVEGQAAQADVALEREVALDLPSLRADERRLRQILLNLLSNAVKFTPSGGRVRVIAFEDAGEMVIQISDTGIGMAPADIPRALERFGQLNGDLNRKYEGAGLGLPLTKKLVDLHGGRLEIESAVGEGTKVTIAFPADRVEARMAA